MHVKTTTIFAHPNYRPMPNVKFRTSRCTLLSRACGSLIGLRIKDDGVDSIYSHSPTMLGMRTSDVIKSYLVNEGWCLCLKRLLSGKFSINGLILYFAQLAYSFRRLVGLLGMIVELGAVRALDMWRRQRTVLKELVHPAALLIVDLRYSLESDSALIFNALRDKAYSCFFVESLQACSSQKCLQRSAEKIYFNQIVNQRKLCQKP